MGWGDPGIARDLQAAIAATPAPDNNVRDQKSGGPACLGPAGVSK
jgi:hypothetical protein